MTDFDKYMLEVAERRVQYRKELESRGVRIIDADYGDGPAMDYGKGPGSWTGD